MQKIYSVIHASDPEQIFRNIERTITAGADGTFVINHAGIYVIEMMKAIETAKKRFNGFFIGLNPLGVDELNAFKLAQSVEANGLWLDESFIRENSEVYDERLAKMDEARKDFTGLYFGSVAFKTQGVCKNPITVAQKAISHVDVVTTSGPATANAPSVDKIASMKTAIGDKPLGIASGMSPDNIELYPMADHILVASGISDEWTEINTEKLRLMVERKFKKG